MKTSTLVIGALGLGLVYAFATHESIKPGDDAIVSLAKLPPGSPELALLAQGFPPNAVLLVRVTKAGGGVVTGAVTTATVLDAAGAPTPPGFAIPPGLVGERAFPKSAVVGVFRDGKKVG